jgi:hypothetical protein
MSYTFDLSDNISNLLNECYDFNSSHTFTKMEQSHFPKKSFNLSNHVFTISLINDAMDIK